MKKMTIGVIRYSQSPAIFLAALLASNSDRRIGLDRLHAHYVDCKSGSLEVSGQFPESSIRVNIVPKLRSRF